MKTRDARKAVKGLFPTATPEQSEMAAEMLDKISPSMAWSVLKTHRASHEFLSFPMLAEAIRTAHSRKKSDEASFANERMVDGIRREARERWGIQDYQSMDDANVIMAHFYRLIESVENCPLQLRIYVVQKCRQALTEIGRDNSEALQRACEIADIKPENLRDVTCELIKSQKGVPVLSGLLM